jgi:hypothetical protein
MWRATNRNNGCYSMRLVTYQTITLLGWLHYITFMVVFFYFGCNYFVCNWYWNNISFSKECKDTWNSNANTEHVTYSKMKWQEKIIKFGLSVHAWNQKMRAWFGYLRATSSTHQLHLERRNCYVDLSDFGKARFIGHEMILWHSIGPCSRLVHLESKLAHLWYCTSCKAWLGVVWFGVREDVTYLA